MRFIHRIVPGVENRYQRGNAGTPSWIKFWEGADPRLCPVFKHGLSRILAYVNYNLGISLG
jgi:hypothetical protein